MFEQSNAFAKDSDGPLIPRRSLHHQSEFDITAMIDLVFMMNIYFLVTSISAVLADIDLPAARNCVVADLDSSVVITILAAKGQEPPAVYIGEDRNGEPLTEPQIQHHEVLKAVTDGARAQLNTVVIRAEKEVPLRELMRVARIVSSVEGMQLKVSVAEKE